MNSIFFYVVIAVNIVVDVVRVRVVIKKLLIIINIIIIKIINIFFKDY